MSTFLLRSLGSLALAVGLLTPAWACGPYRVSLYDFGRLYYRNAQGQATGIDKDIIDALAQRSGCSFEVSVDSRVRIWAGIKAGTLDVATSAVATPERLALGDIAAYLQARNQLLVRQAAAPRLTSLAAFMSDPDARVVVVKSFVNGPPFDAWLAALRQQGKVSEVGDYGAAIRVFAGGRADAMIASTLTLGAVRQAFGATQGFVELEGVHTKFFPAGLLMSRRTVSPADRTRLSKGLAEMLRDGTVYDILKRHLDERIAQTARVQP